MSAAGPFVRAVTDAVNARHDNWECGYYSGPDFDWNPRRRAVYMHTRESALGPEWRSCIRAVMRMQGEIAA